MAPADATGRIDYLLVAPTLEYSAPTLYALTLAQGLLDRGYRIRVLTPGGRYEAVFRERGIPCDVEPNLERFGFDWFSRRRLAAEMRAAGLRAVHSTSSLKIDVASALARRIGVPLLCTIHRYWNPITSRDIEWTDVGAIITLSEDLREDIVNRRRAPKDLVRVIPAGILAPADGSPPFDRTGAVPIVGTLGDVDKAAGQMDFLHAAREVLDKVPSIEFVVVSGGAEPKHLRQAARDLGVARATTFTEVIDTRKALALMDVCVLPGVEEGPGQTILEAMAAGRPVITSGAGGAYDCIRDEESGLLFHKGDRAGLAAAILRLVEDPIFARRIGARAREIALEHFALDRMLDDTIATYESLAPAHIEEKRGR
jgi:glycosyltransferase involved in cell wall biosynthesis